MCYVQCDQNCSQVYCSLSEIQPGDCEELILAILEDDGTHVGDFVGAVGLTGCPEAEFHGPDQRGQYGRDDNV